MLKRNIEMLHISLNMTGDIIFVTEAAGECYTEVESSQQFSISI